LQNNLPMIQDYHMYMDQLENYPSEIEFPENGRERLNILKEKLLPLQSELSILKVNKTKIETKQIKLRDQQLDKDVFEEAKAILMKKDDYREQIRERENIQEKIDILGIKLRTALN